MLSSLLPFLLYTPALAAPQAESSSAPVVSSSVTSRPAPSSTGVSSFVSSAAPVTVAASTVTTASAPATTGTCNNGANCYAAAHGWANYEPYQGHLMDACTGDDGVVSGTGNLWGSKACVAVAVSNRKVWPQLVQGLASCGHQQIACQADQPNLDYNVYASIVGDCAWEPNGCPITQQNFIDFIYSTLSDIGSADWPSDVNTLVSEGWQPLLDWTKTGDSIPYTNFNDFLHYA
ncbi:uncharacterized protein SCHCODRAFT_02519573 [Schizophyllum commune H4-8]|nr:uncharacterized protein SCHCODRAFT_02519573 [Schizophyllum commune H4-8]KAI5886210.1 hypothetical protein SCHCODRAFT_02519573 [Schizophyllum commune H4-8]